MGRYLTILVIVCGTIGNAVRRMLQSQVILSYCRAIIISICKVSILSSERSRKRMACRLNMTLVAWLGITPPIKRRTAKFFGTKTECSWAGSSTCICRRQNPLHNLPDDIRQISTAKSARKRILPICFYSFLVTHSQSQLSNRVGWDP